MYCRLTVRTLRLSRSVCRDAAVAGDQPQVTSSGVIVDDADWGPQDERQHDELTELFERYFEDADAEIALMERAIRQDRAVTVEASASRLGSASLEIGADLVSPIVAELEARAHGDNLSLAAHLVASLERALVQTRAALSGLPGPA
jgi:hypothetical protein